MFQASMCKIRHTLLSSSSPPSIGLSRLTGSTVLNSLPGEPSTMTENISGKYEVKKKESIPVRIAGDFDGGMLDGPLNATVGVWRTVGVAKGAKPTNSPGVEVSSSLPHNSFNEEGMLSYGQRQPLQELLDGMAIIVQQATSFVDVALDADCGDGPYGWLALQEQWRRGFSCGPSMVHAGCGGILASCHSLDIAGMELVDPLSADVNASSVFTLIQSDIKNALKSAFGILDGPLSATDWCKGRSQSGDVGTTGDGFSAEHGVNEGRDSSSTVTIGEPISHPSHLLVDHLASKVSFCFYLVNEIFDIHCTNSWTIVTVSSVTDGARVDDTCRRRPNQEFSSSESEQQLGSRLRPTLLYFHCLLYLLGMPPD
ncbi:Mediator of RNA polymerase II transcription subunit 13 [Vitis vinifera]|uniref:Mediator of RNA polymerase II transcription subunit 13 n=1 Tax=Vitis vinifera TaxID=29760 RepID=A0A438EM45_VITVI|nr:Mediator of RNA polymerase II transcription subunit 13 [Vitis vinifera]